MKKKSIAAPLSITAALACVISLNSGCSKKNNPPAPSEPTTPTTNAADAAGTVTNADVTISNTATGIAVAEPTITNPPPAATTPVAPPAAPEPAPTAQSTEPQHTVVEMPTTVPTAPTNFYSGDNAKKSAFDTDAMSSSEQRGSFSLLLRAGYQHANRGDNHDTVYASVKFGYDGEALRERIGKNSWLIPDIYAELAHQYVAKPDNAKQPGSGEGLQFRANFYWPWINWTSYMFSRTNAASPMRRPLVFSVGPTANVGFDDVFDDSDVRLARYVGVRATLNHGFIEYTAGKTEGLSDTRSQVLTEVPFYFNGRNGIGFYFRGLWNSGLNNTHDQLEGGVFMEVPIETLVRPSTWRHHEDEKK